VADHNIEGHFRLLLRLLEGEPLRGAWNKLALTVEHFAALGLQPGSPDKDVWLACQKREVILVTANRRQKDADSLEHVIGTLNRPDSLPIFTLANPSRVLEGKAYTRRVAEELLRYLLEIDNYRGTGRLYIP
jgi:hypothetical protein